MTVSPEAVRDVAERWFPNASVRVSRAGAGSSTPVFRVHIDGETFWARLAEAKGELRNGEEAAHRLLSALGLPVPSIVRYESHPPEIDRSMSLTTHIPGRPLSTCPPASWHPATATEAGRVLAAINRMPVTGFGWAYASGDRQGPVGEHRSRSAWALEYLHGYHVVRERAVFDTPVVERLGAAIEEWSGYPDRSIAHLAHGDFDTSHIYVDPDCHCLTGMIDFGELRGADRLYDLGHVLLHDGEAGRPRLFPHILDGYSDIQPLPDDVMEHIRIQAMVIGTRALAIQLGRPPSPYRQWLTSRLESLANTRSEQDRPPGCAEPD